MSDVFGTVITILLCTYLMFIGPIQYYKFQEKITEEMYIINETTYFIDNIRNTGILSDVDYFNYKRELYKLSDLYKIKISVIDYKDDMIKNSLSELEILEELKEHNNYLFDQGDYIKITIQNKNKLVICYGGSIKNEVK